LVDLLLNEALEKVSPDVRAQINKVGHGVYRMGSKEVTLHTTNGRLFVYRIGDVVRHVPIETLLKEEGLLTPPSTIAPAPVSLTPTPAAAFSPGPSAGSAAIALLNASAAAGAAAAASAAAAAEVRAAFGDGSVDTPPVARIARQTFQISSGIAATGGGSSGSMVQFGLGRNPDAQALMSKRVEAATKAMNVSKQIVRRSVNFEDEKLLRKLLTKGLKHDKQWQQAYQDYCTNRGIADTDHKNQNKEFVANFLENNLAGSINEDWAKKIIYPGTEPEGEKKEKKDKKKQEGQEEKGQEEEGLRLFKQRRSSGWGRLSRRRRRGWQRTRPGALRGLGALGPRK